MVVRRQRPPVPSVNVCSVHVAAANTLFQGRLLTAWTLTFSGDDLENGALPAAVHAENADLGAPHEGQARVGKELPAPRQLLRDPIHGNYRLRGLGTAAAARRRRGGRRSSAGRSLVLALACSRAELPYCAAPIGSTTDTATIGVVARPRVLFSRQAREKVYLTDLPPVWLWLLPLSLSLLLAAVLRAAGGSGDVVDVADTKDSSSFAAPAPA